ncbi:gamma-glutamyltransferase family protein [Rhizobium rhizogenes]|uniref:gamma-glutamyltransferase family protein n=1 Tax=Rhizobium rhizogenes TaxID=359 RepID=UPI00157263F4|nr:gamma-glutamyltransferase [Rhizobium rhizogenes]NTI38086.1 gamma-glutamyltransferase [Rhizobium rhizogenes]WEO69518.1 gamma-glutamyltransferase [Rhizobium rhizogenes]
MSETWHIGKHETRSRHGMVACQNWRAAEAGAAVLSAGGNAIDAAVTTALVLSVVEPWLSGIGGGGFMVRADANGAVDALDFNVISPAAINPADYPLVPGRDGDWFDWPSVEGDRNLIGYSSICVPGAIAGFAEALARFGTISWADALAPAIEQAHRGLQLDWYAALALAIDGANLAQFPAASELFLHNGRAPRVPEGGRTAFLPMKAKARTLERLAAAGPRDFYEGELADQLIKGLADGGSVLSEQDFSGHAPRWLAPLTQEFRGLVVHAVPELSGGSTLCAILSELETSLPENDPFGGTAALAFARAIRRASEYRLKHLGHAAGESCTSHLSVVDADGTMVSLTNTLLSRFGSKVVVPETGFAFNNGMMWFDPRPGQPNSIAPASKPLANMSPIVATRDGVPELALGAAGGRQIVPAVTQILSYVAAYGLSLEDAFLSSRIDASGTTIRVNRTAASDVAPTVASEFNVEVIDDTLYPVNFAVPSAVLRRSGINTGMVHPKNPWAAVREADPR